MIMQRLIGVSRAVFSPAPDESPDAILTSFGWTLRGTRLDNDVTCRVQLSNFFVCGHEWPTERKEIENSIVTDEGEQSRI